MSHLDVSPEDRMLEHLLSTREEAKDVLFVRREPGAGISLVRLLDSFAQKGFVLHASSQLLPVLVPRLGDSKHSAYGNLRAIYATRVTSDCLRHGFWSLVKSGKPGWGRIKKTGDLTSWVRSIARSSQAVYVYIFNESDFVLLPNGKEFVRFKKTAPEFVVAASVQECVPYAKQNKTLSSDQGLDWRLEKFIEDVERVYLRHARLSAGEHGIMHARQVTNFGCWIARQECPSLMRDVVVGCFFHDIGRADNAGGHEHAYDGEALARSIIRKHWPRLKAKEILFAIRHHADGQKTAQKIARCVWDADRLALIRMGHPIDPAFLSTKEAKRAARGINAVIVEAKRVGAWESKT